MIKRYVLAAAVAAAAIGAVVALVVIATGEEPEPLATPPQGDPVVLETSVTPPRYDFGDRLLAEVRLTIDRTRVDPDTVVSVPVFRPFQRAGPVRVERADLGDTTVLRLGYPIQCVARGCVPDGAEQELELSLGLLRYTPREGDNVTLPLAFPAVTVDSRLPDDVRQDIQARPAALAASFDLDELPALPFRGGPSLLGWLLVGAAAAIVLGLGGWLAWRLWPRADEAAPALAAPAIAPLPAALALVEGALAAEEPERRVALDELAQRLDDAGEVELAREARQLAWSQAGPQRDSAARLAVEVRDRTNGEAGPR
jgi:hypothetical protein